MKYLVQAVFTLLWIAGWVIAEGFWSTFFAVVFVPWGWYLVAERILQMLQVIG